MKNIFIHFLWMETNFRKQSIDITICNTLSALLYPKINLGYFIFSLYSFNYRHNKQTQHRQEIRPKLFHLISRRKNIIWKKKNVLSVCNKKHLCRLFTFKQNSKLDFQFRLKKHISADRNSFPTECCNDLQISARLNFTDDVKIRPTSKNRESSRRGTRDFIKPQRRSI